MIRMRTLVLGGFLLAGWSAPGFVAAHSALETEVHGTWSRGEIRLILEAPLDQARLLAGESGASDRGSLEEIARVFRAQARAFRRHVRLWVGDILLAAQVELVSLPSREEWRREGPHCRAVYRLTAAVPEGARGAFRLEHDLLAGREGDGAPLVARWLVRLEDEATGRVFEGSAAPGFPFTADPAGEKTP